MRQQFYKYHGAGNDFIMIDDRDELFPHNDQELIASLCRRRFGVGADGLILLRNAKGYDYRMVYFNADGRESSMCGNGGRCVVLFANEMGIAKREQQFIAIDGPHDGRIMDDGLVSIKMKDVPSVERVDEHYVLDTGSPHYVSFQDSVQDLDVVSEARKIRYAEPYKLAGINVNFASPNAEQLDIRTYERGVEDETYACGTGVTAVALAWAVKQQQTGKHVIQVNAVGGHLWVEFENKGNKFENIWLTGPAVEVFDGHVELRTP